MSSHGHSLARDFSADLDGSSLESPLDREHGGEIHAWAKKAGINAAQIIDFSASINPLGPPASARVAFQKSYTEVTRYPDPYGEELKEALAKRHAVQPGELLIGNGSTQLIYLICRALQPREALIAGPAFSEYANALKLAGTKVRFLSPTADGGLRFSTENFLAAWADNADIGFLTTPNSVTGRLIPRGDLEKIACVALRRKKILIVDEAFIDFVEAESVKLLIRDNPYLIILRSLTKYYALAGLRLGYLLAHSRRAEQLGSYLEPWSVNGPAQKVALACLADRRFELKTERWLHRERNFLEQALTTLKGFQTYPSSTNFLLVRTVNGSNVLELRSFLLSKKILIRACGSFTGLGPNHFRIAVKRRKDNLRLLQALRKWTAVSRL